MYKQVKKIDYEKCIGCMECVDACPNICISESIHEGILHPKLNDNECAACGQCIEVCPVDAIEMEE